MQFSAAKQVRCIFFSDSGNIANKVSVQAYEDGEWTDVRLIDNLPKKVLILSPPSTGGEFSFQNIAILPSAKANQSSTVWSGDAARAKDDCTNGDFHFGSVTHTDFDTNP